MAISGEDFLQNPLHLKAAPVTGQKQMLLGLLFLCSTASFELLEAYLRLRCHRLRGASGVLALA
jgi:hypothetical protein